MMMTANGLALQRRRFERICFLYAISGSAVEIANGAQRSYGQQRQKKECRYEKPKSQEPCPLRRYTKLRCHGRANLQAFSLAFTKSSQKGSQLVLLKLMSPESYKSKTNAQLAN